MNRRAALMSETLTSKGVVDGVIQDDWETINKIAKAGRAQEFYSIGNKKDISVDGVSVNVVLVGFDHDTKTDGAKANTSWLSTQEGVLDRYMPCVHDGSSNPRSVWNGGGSFIPIIFTEGLLARFPATLQEGIVQVRKGEQGWTGTTPTTRTRSRKVWVPSLRELGISVESRGSEGDPYPFFSSGKKLSSQTSYFWTRSLGTTSTVGSSSGWTYTAYTYVFRPSDLAYEEALHASLHPVLFGFCL